MIATANEKSRRNRTPAGIRSRRLTSQRAYRHGRSAFRSVIQQQRVTVSRRTARRKFRRVCRVFETHRDRGVGAGCGAFRRLNAPYSASTTWNNVGLATASEKQFRRVRRRAASAVPLTELHFQHEWRRSPSFFQLQTRASETLTLRLSTSGILKVDAQFFDLAVEARQAELQPFGGFTFLWPLP